MVDAVHDWNGIPSDFGLCDPEDDLAVMMAFTRTVSRMRAHEYEEQERKMEIKTRRPRKSGKGRR